MRIIARGSSGIVDRMDYPAILARNLAYFMSKPDALYTNANALGVACSMSPTTVRKMLEPTKRSYQSAKKGPGPPSTVTLVMLAEKLGCQVWELVHPDLERAHALMRAGEAAVQALKPEPLPMHQPRRSTPVRYVDTDLSPPALGRRQAEPVVLAPGPTPHPKRA